VVVLWVAGGEEALVMLAKWAVDTVQRAGGAGLQVVQGNTATEGHVSSPTHNAPPRLRGTLREIICR